MAKASRPLIRTIPIPPSPKGVDIAAIVSLSFDTGRAPLKTISYSGNPPSNKECSTNEYKFHPGHATLSRDRSRYTMGLSGQAKPSYLETKKKRVMKTRICFHPVLGLPILLCRRTPTDTVKRLSHLLCSLHDTTTYLNGSSPSLNDSTPLHS